MAISVSARDKLIADLHAQKLGPSSIAVRVGLLRRQVVEVLRRDCGYREADDVPISDIRDPKRRAHR